MAAIASSHSSIKAARFLPAYIGQKQQVPCAHLFCSVLQRRIWINMDYGASAWVTFFVMHLSLFVLYQHSITDYESCYFPFIYNGISYSDCVSGSHSPRWCATTAKSVDRIVSPTCQMESVSVFLVLVSIVTECGVNAQVSDVSA
jgi:hypothetical protein